MKIANKLMMFHMAVSDMERAKDFYVEKLGFSLTKDYRQDDTHWWVSLELPEGGVSINITTFPENMKTGTMKLYFSTHDIKKAYNALKDKKIQATGEIKEDPWGTWFEINDPDGNRLFIVEELTK